MFARWQNTRLKAAEKALDQGRLDEAYAAALEPDVRDQSRGQKLLDGLVKPLLARARLHVQAGRYADALADLDRLAAIQRDTPDARTLRQRVAEELRRTANETAEKRDAYVRAADDLRAGRLESGRVAIERVDDAAKREELQEELDARAQRSREVLEQARSALESGDALAAVRFWQDACRRHGRTRATDEFALRCAAALRQTLDRWLDDGHVERLLAARPSLDLLRPVDPSLAEYERVIGLCSQAAGQLGGRDLVGLRQMLLRLKAARSEARWVSAALDATTRAVEAVDLLLSSPLGLCLTQGTVAPAGPAELRAATALKHPRPAPPSPPRGGTPLSNGRLMLLVDGTGSALFVTNDLVRIGRAGAAAEVPFSSEVQSHHADIRREGEDYFLTAYGTTLVNHQRVTRTLLRDGDRIEFGPRAKMVFQKPSAKSTTAVLRLSHAVRLPQDVSSVILFGETCLIGPQPSCHIRTREGESQVVLFDRGGLLMAQHASTGGRHLGQPHALGLGQTTDFGDVRLTVQAYDAGVG